MTYRRLVVRVPLDDLAPRFAQIRADAGVGPGRSSAVDRACIDAVEAVVLDGEVGETFDAVGLDDDTVQLSQPAVAAPCRGDIPVGQRLRVWLVRADVSTGVRFEVAA